MKLLTVDIGGTELKYGIVDHDLVLFEKGSLPTPQSNLDDLIEQIAILYDEHKTDVQGIAISMPGFIDSKNGICYHGGALTYNANQPFSSLLSTRCSCPVHIENDGKAAAIAEFELGALKGCQNGAVFLIGTGVGGGLIVNEKLVRGKTFTAGEFSYLNVIHSKDSKQGSSMLTEHCSTTALLNNYRKKSNLEIEINGIEFFDRLSNHDEIAKIVFDEFCMHIAIQVLNLGILLNTEVVAIGGGISKQPILVETIRERLSDINPVYYSNVQCLQGMVPAVVNCHFRADANLIGAYLSFLKEY